MNSKHLSQPRRAKWRAKCSNLFQEEEEEEIEAQSRFELQLGIPKCRIQRTSKNSSPVPNKSLSLLQRYNSFPKPSKATTFRISLPLPPPRELLTASPLPSVFFTFHVPSNNALEKSFISRG